MKPRKTPQEKKRLSYQKDCRNRYRENDKSSRTSIRFRKRYVNKAYRKAVKQNLLPTGIVVDEQMSYDVQQEVLSVKRKFWQKVSDMPLGAYIQRQKQFSGRRIKAQ